MLPVDAVAVADTVVLDCVQLITLEEVADTVAVVLLEVTVAVAVEVQPLLCVTVTV